MSFAIRRSAERRLLILFAVALLVFVAAVVRQIVGQAPSAAISSPSPVEDSIEATIARLQAYLQANPEGTAAYAELGLAYLQRVRETGDAAYYGLAEQAFAEALAREPQQLNALIGQGALALAQHRFQQALEWGEQARAVNPFRAEVLGIMTDALVELGRYDEAVETAQAMVDLRPDLASYSRVAYLRELHGDMAGAIAAMQAAVDAGQPGAEGTSWAEVELGHLFFNSGDLERAEESYRQALRLRPEYPYALGGLARVQAARGHYEAAIEQYQLLTTRLPLPEFAIRLGELHEAAGQTQLAQERYELVRLIQQLNAGAGMDVDLELALFEADHGANPAAAVQMAREAFDRRPSVVAADVLAWALYRNGEYEAAWEYSQQALRLGTRDANFHYHAGMIAYALGDELAARHHLSEALAINPYFSTLHAPRVHELLEQLAK